MPCFKQLKKEKVQNCIFNIAWHANTKKTIKQWPILFSLVNVVQPPLSQIPPQTSILFSPHSAYVNEPPGQWALNPSTGCQRNRHSTAARQPQHGTDYPVAFKSCAYSLSGGCWQIAKLTWHAAHQSGSDRCAFLLPFFVSCCCYCCYRVWLG